jgi:hypothetical protein
MAAGLGYIEFNTGDVLTAAQANGYLASQVVMVFADAAARTSAIASPQEGMISYLKDTNSTEYYSGSAWAAIGAGGGGKVLQVVQYILVGEASTSSGSFVDTGLDVTITPSAATSKVLILGQVNQANRPSGNVNNSIGFNLRRASTDIYEMGDLHMFTSVSADQMQTSGFGITYLDSPATTSATTYKLRYKSYTAGQTVKINSFNTYTVSSSILAMEIGA